MKNPHHSDSENWWLLVVSSDEDTCDQWQTTHFTLSLMTSLLLLLALPTGRPCQCTASKTLFHKHSTQTIKKACHKSGFMMDLNTDHCGRSWKPYRIATDMLLGVGYFCFFWIPLIIPSPMNLLIQSCSHSHQNYGRDILTWLLVTSHQTRKWDTTLKRFRFKQQQQP